MTSKMGKQNGTTKKKSKLRVFRTTDTDATTTELQMQNLNQSESSLTSVGGFKRGFSLESNQDLLSPSTPIQVPTYLSEKAQKRKEKKAKQKERKMARKNRPSSETDPMWQLEKHDTQEGGQVGQVSLCKCPFRTMEYFLREIPCILMDGKKRLFSFLLSRMYNGPLCNEPWFVKLFEVVGTLTFFGCLFMGTYLWITLNDSMSLQIKREISWHSYWIFLGILSSVGLGTGLHTFVLYLGPFIAKVTLAAEECFTLNFPQPPYPEKITCPRISVADAAWQSESEMVSVLDIMQKVRFETFCWGLGTALGELPPYFMARAARLSDRIKEDDTDKLKISPSSTKLESKDESFAVRAKTWITQFVKKLGFWGILACASIPNPLFDLAGLTCGHFLVPFVTFFGATLIGKMVIKSQLQMIFVILAFNERSLARVLQCLERIPFVGSKTRTVFAEFVDHQRTSLHNKGDTELHEKQNMIQYILEKIVLCMVLYFVISIINGMAESYHRRLVDEQLKQKPVGNQKKKKEKVEK